MSDPRNIFALEDIQLLTGYQVQPFFSMPEDIKKSLSEVYAEEEQSEELPPEEDEEEERPIESVDIASESKELLDELLGGLDGVSTGDLQLKKDEKVDIMEVDASAPETEKLANAILLEALRFKASDIHSEPMEKRMLVRYRVDGVPLQLLETKQ